MINGRNFVLLRSPANFAQKGVNKDSLTNRILTDGFEQMVNIYFTDSKLRKPLFQPSNLGILDS